MQIKTFTIPAFGGELLTEEMNVFLRTKKVLLVENQLISQPNGAFWCFCIRYVDDVVMAERDKPKVDYRLILDEATFKTFSDLRVIRKQISITESIPAFAIFTDEELSGIAKLETVNAISLKTIKGIGEKKVEKYGHHFFSKTEG
jgi:superfamily II DNA helicase RecQ